MKSLITDEQKGKLATMNIPLVLDISHITNKHELKVADFDDDGTLALLWYEDKQEDGFIFGIEIMDLVSKKNKNVSLVRARALVGTELEGQKVEEREFESMGDFYFRTFADAFAYLLDMDGGPRPLTEEEIVSLANKE